MELIRRLSEHVDEICLDYLRYRLCSIDRVDALPGRAGQLQSDHMMASAVLYNAARCEGRIIAGSAFTHFVVRGLGLPLEPIRDDGFPGDGEVGLVARRALALYRLLLKADAQTTKVIQALALLDFMACPSDYINSTEIAKKIAPYIAKTPDEYNSVLERFKELHGKRDGKRYVGLRT
jgi:hypothetical protein